VYNIRNSSKLNSYNLEASINASDQYGITIIQNILAAIDKHPKIKVIGIGTMRYVHINNFLREWVGKFSDTGLVQRKTVTQFNTFGIIGEIDFIGDDMWGKGE
jgi:hypothetical protein